MAYEVKKNIDALIPKTTVPGELRGDVEADLKRQQDTQKALGPKAGSADVGLKGHDAAAQPHTAKGLLGTAPQQTGHDATPRPATSEKVPLTVRPEAAAGQETRDTHATGTLQPRVSPNSQEMEQAVRAGKKALKGLSDLAQGGKNVAQKMLAATVTPKEAFQKAFTSNLLGAKSAAPKSTAQSKLSETPAKTATPTRPSQEPATHEAVAAKVKAEAQGTQTGDAGEAAAKAQVIAQKVSSPLLSEKGNTRSENDRKEIKTTRATSRALYHAVHGLPPPQIDDEGEFGAGGYGGYGDPQTESAGLAKKNGPVPVCDYGESYIETDFLCASIALSGFAGGGVPMNERIQHSIQDRILNTGIASYSERWGDKASQDQAALGPRYSPYGKGTYA